MYRTIPALIFLLLPSAAPTAQECQSRDSQATSMQRGGGQRLASRAAAGRARREALAQRERPERGHRPPALVAALDANADGVLSADEIANAAAALLTLDANGDGQLTREELAPAAERGRQERRGERRGDRDQRGDAQDDATPELSEA